MNQLARKERLQVRSLVTAAERLRATQVSLPHGGSPDELHDAAARQREVVGALLESARNVLHSAGTSATEATLERIRQTLMAVAGNEEGARLVEKGRLWRDLDPAGFGPLMPGPGAEGKPVPRAKSARGAGKRTAAPAERQRKEEPAAAKLIEGAKQELEGIHAEMTEQKARLRRAKSEARAAEDAAETAVKTVRREEAELERLTARLEAAQEALRRARSPEKPRR